MSEPRMPKPKPPLVPIRRLLPFDEEDVAILARDFKAGACMGELANAWGVDVLVIQEVIRQVMLRQDS